MDKTETQKYAELIISMSTDYLLSNISEEHYKKTLKMAVDQLNK